MLKTVQPKKSINIYEEKGAMEKIEPLSNVNDARKEFRRRKYMRVDDWEKVKALKQLEKKREIGIVGGSITRFKQERRAPGEAKRQEALFEWYEQFYPRWKEKLRFRTSSKKEVSIKPAEDSSKKEEQTEDYNKSLVSDEAPEDKNEKKSKAQKEFEESDDAILKQIKKKSDDAQEYDDEFIPESFEEREDEEEE